MLKNLQIPVVSCYAKNLNNARREKRLVLRKLNSFVPVNDECPNPHLEFWRIEDSLAFMFYTCTYH